MTLFKHWTLHARFAHKLTVGTREGATCIQSERRLEPSLMHPRSNIFLLSFYAPETIPPMPAQQGHQQHPSQVLVIAVDKVEI